MLPTRQDRARQDLVKLAVEPEWEAKFEPNSYGFRPGRSAHDAIDAINALVSSKTKYVLDADIAGCFDHISHEALLAKLNTTPTIRRLVKGWLKAGVMAGMEVTPTEEGTPQGGVITPPTMWQKSCRSSQSCCPVSSFGPAMEMDLEARPCCSPLRRVAG